MEVDALNDRLFLPDRFEKLTMDMQFSSWTANERKPGNFKSSDFSSIYSEFIAKEGLMLLVSGWISNLKNYPPENLT